MPDKSLTRMFAEVRWQTLRILDGVTETEARWAPVGLQNTILWHAGHAYTVVEWTTMESLGRQPVYPDDWFAIFSGNELTPDDVAPARWPTLETVVAALVEQRDRLGDVFAALAESDLSLPAAQRPQRTVRYMILHGIYDEAAHGGEMWLLRKLQQSAPSSSPAGDAQQ